MIPTVISKNGVPTRLTDEGWAHIAEEHGELAEMQEEVLETIAQPNRILVGGDGELLEEANMALADVQEYLKLLPVIKRSPQATLWLGAQGAEGEP